MRNLSPVFGFLDLNNQSYFHKTDCFFHFWKLFLISTGVLDNTIFLNHYLLAEVFLNIFLNTNHVALRLVSFAREIIRIGAEIILIIIGFLI